MDEWLKILGQNVAAVVTATLFLYFMKSRDDREEKREEARQALQNKRESEAHEHYRALTQSFNRTMHQQHDDLRRLLDSVMALVKDAIKVMAEIREETAQNTAATQEMRQAVEAFRRDLNRKAELPKDSTGTQ